MRIKTPAVAGSFYPAEKENLLATVNSLLDSNPNTGACPIAMQVPHAGLRFSGGIAAHAYNRVKPYREQFNRVVVLGPAHRVGSREMVTIDADMWQTPLGRIPLDKVLADRLIKQGLLKYDNRVHAQEHCIEVQLPFLQTLGMGSLPLLPVVVGQALTNKVAQLCNEVLEMKGTLLLISSDLSHFNTKADAEAIDKQTLAQLNQLDASIGSKQACGCHALNGILEYAKNNNLYTELLAKATSADVGGDVNRVVGYSAVAFYAQKEKSEPEAVIYSEAEQQYLLKLARHAIASEFSEQQALIALETTLMQRHTACFVTLNIEGKLRGCIGNLESRDSLVKAIPRNAKQAAFKDQRFKPLSLEELPVIEIELSILTPMQAIEISSEADLLNTIRPGIDGLLFESGKNRATFLPSVWQQVPDPKQFLVQLKRKAGLGANYWNSDVRCSVYQSIKMTDTEGV